MGLGSRGLGISRVRFRDVGVSGLGNLGLHVRVSGFRVSG